MFDYKRVAVYKERQLNHKVNDLSDKIDRLKTLLYNSIVCLEEEQIFATHELLLNYLGMTEKEYKEIMGE